MAAMGDLAEEADDQGTSASTPVDRHIAAMDTFGERVKEERKRANLTQEGLAEKTGLAASYIAQTEQGRRNITFVSLLTIADGIGINVAVLVDDLHVGDSPPRKPRAGSSSNG